MFFKTGDEWRVSPSGIHSFSEVGFFSYEEFRAIQRLLSR
jgi:hypothetical protein